MTGKPLLAARCLITALGLLLIAATLNGCAGPSAASAKAQQEQPFASQRMLAQAKAAFLRKDYRAAARLLYPLAMSGDADAQYALGYMLFYGRGVPRDEAKAMKLFRAAAGQGNRAAAQAIADFRANSKQGAQPAPGAQPRRLSEARPDSAPNPILEAAREAVQQELHPPRYTIQLLGSRSEADLRQVIEAFGLKQTSVHRESRHDHPWYQLLYGRFQTADEARKAIDGLPQALRENAPWVRRIPRGTPPSD